LITPTPRALVALPSLFDSAEPAFMTEDALAASGAQAAEPALDLFDNPGGGDTQPHETCSY
jgi:hypothetical protein